MSYVAGFVAAVSEDRRQEYLEFARKSAAIFRDYGATRVVETWGDAVPDGQVTDFRRAVQAGPGEVVVFSWIEFPSREIYDQSMKRMMEDPRFAELGAMPFDGKRMIYGGFSTILDA